MPIEYLLYVPFIWLIPSFIYFAIWLGEIRSMLQQTDINLTNLKKVEKRNYQLAKVDQISFVSMRNITLVALLNIVLTITALIFYIYFNSPTQNPTL